MSGKKIFVAVALAVLLSIMGLYQCFKYQLTPIHETIATDFVVGMDWQDISIPSPLRVRRQVQHITLNVDGYSHQNDPSSGPFHITLHDGTVAKPEVQIIDESGGILVLEDDVRLGDTIGFSPSKGGFPADRTYVMVRIRSDIPLKVSKLGWLDMNLK